MSVAELLWTLDVSTPTRLIIFAIVFVILIVFCIFCVGMKKNKKSNKQKHKNTLYNND